jgi:hypothetical protein
MRRRQEKPLGTPDAGLAVGTLAAGIILAMSQILDLQGRPGWMDDRLVAVSATRDAAAAAWPLPPALRIFVLLESSQSQGAPSDGSVMSGH